MTDRTGKVPMVHDYKQGLNLSVQLNRWILRLIGAWPISPKTSWIEKCAYKLINVICYSLISFIFIPCGLYMVFEVKDTYAKIKLTGPMSFCVMATIKYYFIMFRSDDIRKCIEYIESDWKTITHFKDRTIMINNANFGRRLELISAFFMYGGVAFYYVIFPASVGKIIAEDTNLTFIPLIYPISKLIADARYSPLNEVFFTMQFFYGFVSHTITTAGCSLAAVFAMHACGQLEVLMSWLEHLIDGREDLCKDVNDRLAAIVERHVRVLSFLALSENVLQQISLVELIGCTLNMCFLGYYIIMEWDSEDPARFITYLILLISLTFNIFIFCYIGEIVAEQCQKVGDASYMTDWYRLPKKQGLDLDMVMIMSNSSIKLTAGNFIDLSITSFGDVVKTSVAYLNMLRTLTT